MKSQVFYIFLFFYLIGNISAQTSIEKERLIAKSYYYLLDNDSIASDSTAYYYSEGNNFVEDPYKTYLGRLFDTLENFFFLPKHIYEEYRFNLEYDPLNKQYSGMILQYDSSDIFGGSGENYQLDFKEKRNWENDLLTEFHELQCGDTGCTIFDEFTFYEYTENDMLSKSFYLKYTEETTSFDTLNLIKTYSYDDDILNNFISGKLHPLADDVYLLEDYLYSTNNKLEKVNNYSILYSDSTITDSTHINFIYDGDNIINYKKEGIIDGIGWIEQTNITFTYEDDHLHSIFGLYTYINEDDLIIIDTVNIIYYLGSGGRIDSIVKFKLPSPNNDIEKEYFEYDVTGNLIDYIFTGNFYYDRMHIEYNYDEFNRLISKKMTYESDIYNDFIENYIYTYTTQGNIKSYEYQVNIYEGDFTSVHLYKYYYETVYTPEEETENLSIQIFPNPTNNLLNIDVQGITPQTSLQLEIYDIQGQQIADQKYTVSMNSTFTFDISTLASGIYIVSVNNGEEFTQKKVVIY